jgi:hypothetical protein
MPQSNKSSSKEEIRNLNAIPSEMLLQYEVIEKIAGYYIL